MESKSLFASKTFWVNAVGGLLIPIATANGINLGAEDIAVIFAAVNIILRFVTSMPVHLKKSAAAMLLLFCLGVAAEGNAQTVTAVDISKGKLQFSWVEGTGGVPTYFKSRCGLSSGNYITSFSSPFVQSSTNLYTIPISAATASSPGTYFCVVLAGNPVGESPPTNEISFFAGTVPAGPTGLGLLAQ